MAQVRRFRQVLAHGTIVEQKVLLRGFIAGITITPSKDAGVITWYDLPAFVDLGVWTGTEAEKIHAGSIREVIRWSQRVWRTAA